MTNLEIEAFLAIVNYGTVSAAAEHLFVTQPALSRRMKALEEELGYQLFHRQKGIREVQMTEEGRAFLLVAQKWKHLWEETSAISKERQPKLTLAAVGSVSSYIFPQVFRNFLMENKECHLSFYNYHSQEAYSYVESGIVDLAFVSDQKYSRILKTIPAFSEPFVIAGGTAFGKEKEVSKAISVEELRPEKEVRLPWNNDYDQWHMQHFSDHVYPHVFLDQMSLMEEFLNEDTWAAVPVSVGYCLQKKGIAIRNLAGGPSDRMIYYLLREENENQLIEQFLQYLNEYLQKLKRVDSYLKK